MKRPCSLVSPLLLIIIILIATLADNLVSAGYNVGVGRADITGPAAEVFFLGSLYLLTFGDFIDLLFSWQIGMMGYAKQGQNTRGCSNSNTDRRQFSLCKG